MRIAVIDQDIPLAGNKRLVKRLWKVPKSKEFLDGLEFAFQFLYFKNNEWLQVVRIDNQLHEGKIGSHIHVLDRKVTWEKLSFVVAEEKIMVLGESIIRNIIDKI